MTTELQQNRYDQLIRRVGGLIGPGSKVSEVISELFPMIDVENVPGELLALMGTRLCFGGTDVAASAGNISRGQLFNAAGSGVIATITRVDFSTNTASTFHFGINETELVTDPNDAQFRDTRFDLSSRPVGRIQNQNNNATLAPINGRIRAAANTNITLQDPNGIAVLLPGDGWNVSPNVVNAPLFFNIFWRERAAEQSELNL